MVLDFKFLVEKYNLDVSGVIHIGAHVGQELPIYNDVGTKNLIMFEPLPFVYPDLLANCKQFKDKINISCYNIALADSIGDREMFTESKNNGQSSSLLEPQNHLMYYPEIQFTEKWRVFCNMLDKIPFDRNKYKGINIDVQGAELIVFKGSEETLKNIQWVYTEINTEYLYKDCVQLYQLDDFLNKKGFERVETGNIHHGWSDALYIRKRDYIKPIEPVKEENDTNSKLEITKKIEIQSIKQEVIRNNYINVPEKFKPNIKIKYPPDNEIIFESWFDKFFYSNQNNTNRHYIPVYTTCYHVNNDFGNNKESVFELQKFIDGLDKEKKYFTIVQYDDGTLIDWKDLDIQVFSMSGGFEQGNNVTITPIPLISKSPRLNIQKDRDGYVATFIGRNTNYIRHLLVQRIFNSQMPGYFADFSLKSKHEYDKIIVNSKFVLAPRGNCCTSFRIFEALNYGVVPVYISDRFWIPFDEPFDYGVLCHADEIAGLMEKLKYADMNYEHLLMLGKKAFEKMFTYTGLANEIINHLKI